MIVKVKSSCTLQSNSGKGLQLFAGQVIDLSELKQGNIFNQLVENGSLKVEEVQVVEVEKPKKREKKSKN